MTTPQTPPADAVARLTELAEWMGDFDEPFVARMSDRISWSADLSSLLAAYADAARDRDKAQVTADLVRRMGGSTVRADDRVPRDELWWLDERGEVAGKVFGLAARTGEAR